MATPITWRGGQTFRVAGTDLHEDTLRIRCSDKKRESVLRLRLPTLCITYADMKFINAIGGRQLRWPDSQVYGPKYFDPPIEIKGQAEVERLTWIRGAHRVVIGPKQTEIEWLALRGLVIPRLHISRKEPIEALLHVDSAVIDVGQQLQIDIAQYANGRPIGGVQVVKRHPDWREPPAERPRYRLWVRVVDAVSRRPLREAKVALFRWKGPLPPASGGGFTRLEEPYTDGSGSVVRDPRPADESLEAVTLAKPGWRATARVFRAMPNEPVSVLLSATQLKATKYPVPVPGASRTIYAAAYNLDPGDTLEQLAAAFRYKDVAELSAMNGVAVGALGGLIPLPGWYFVHAQAGDTLEHLAKEFNLSGRWPRTTGRHHRPEPSTLIEHEIVAIPAPDFAAGRTPG
ncbi:MAG: hypothetical protein U1A78_19315 [Polyangia bacterium]